MGDLVRTCTSILSQLLKCSSDYGKTSTSIFCELLIVDGSTQPVEASWLAKRCNRAKNDQDDQFAIRTLREYPAKGIYSAMNLSLRNLRGDTLLFMNSGDTFYDASSLYRLVEARRNYQISKGRSPRVVFGQALIIPSNKYMPTWLVPDPQVSNISRWLKIFTPNHQAMLVDNDWAVNHEFILDAPHSADLAWIRSALDQNGSYVYLHEPVTKFRLGGISSMKPNFSTLQIRLKEPSRTSLEKIAEICKFALSPIFPIYPMLMYAKSRLLGFLL